MKKFLISSLSVVLSITAYGQDIPQFKLTQNGINPIVIEIEEMTATEMYEKALVWVQESYKNPDEVLKAKFPNEKIRLNGFASDAWSYKSTGFSHSINMDYVLEISFRDGRYKFDYIIGQFYADSGQKLLYSYDAFYKKDGQIKRSYLEAVPSLEKTINDLSQSFYNFVSGKTNVLDDGW